MAYFKFLFAFVSLSIVANVSGSVNDTATTNSTVLYQLDNPCYGRHNGYARDLTSCDRYYYCDNNRPYPGVCDYGFVFDAEIELCVTADNSDRVCFRCSANKYYELISVPNACQQFIRCFNRYPALFLCPNDLVFDGRSGVHQCNRIPPQGGCFRENPTDIEEMTCPPIYNDPVFYVDPIQPSV